jgi:glycosyltransferase involved in cell wall biosynthesis
VVTLALSVAMCTYNGARHLRAQLDSIAAQTRLPDELVVCDDGSTDATLAILERFAAAAPFPVRIHRNRTPLSTPKNFERAIGLAAGEIIALADQDDVWYPPKLERLEQELVRSERIGLVFSDADVVDERLCPAGYRLWQALRAFERHKRLIARGRLFEALVHDNLVTGCTSAFRSAYKDLVIPVPAACAHDSWAALVVAAVAEVARIEAPLLAYRQHAANQSGLARFREKHAPGSRVHKPAAEKIRRIERRASRLRAAYERLDRNRERFPASEPRLRLLRGAIRQAERRLAILREPSPARRVLMASWDLATLRQFRDRGRFRRRSKDLIVRA